MKVYVVICEQHYANFFMVIGTYATQELADAVANKSPDYRTNEFELEGFVQRNEKDDR